jgi:putative heme-binding domain-containing protein
VYETGLGGHAPMRLDYILPGQQFVRFKVRAAVDDGSPGRGGENDRNPNASAGWHIHHDGYTPSKDNLVKAALLVKGDPAVGAKLFASMACSTCHTLNGQGRELGPDLTKIREKYPPPALMEAIADPNAGILVGYETVLIETKDKRTLYGFVIADGDSLTLKDVSGATHTISRKNVAQRETQSYSLMPQLPFKPKQLADLVAYLISKGK